MVRTLTVFFLFFLLSGCPKENTYVPPDLLYLFKNYKVEKNPTAIQSGDFNQDGFTDLVTSNIAANSI